MGLHGGQTGDEIGNVLQELKGTAPRRAASGALNNAASNDNWEFGWKFYAAEAKPADNVFFSPYSISTATAMLVAGAAGETAAQIRSALDFSTDGAAFHGAQSDLALALDARNHAASDTSNAQVLRVSNGIWLKPDFRPANDFLNGLSAYYGASVYLAPFDSAPEQARQAINQKISTDTEQLIPELLPPDSVTGADFVLTNALYFKSNWAEEFSKGSTTDAPFHAQNGTTPNVPLMSAVLEDGQYGSSPGYEVLRLPYAKNELEFVAIMPTAGTFDEFVTHLDADTVTTAVASLGPRYIDLRFPKFKFEHRSPLKERLEGLGMQLAFTENADLSGISPDVYLSDAFHDATIDLDEQGTRAAAATALVARDTSAPTDVPLPVTFDHPFVFFIRDVQSNALLFAGHYANP
jgi:serpin B